jgi:hypothetical protein
MTQKEARILVEIITTVVRKELGAFKKQLLNEGFTQPKVTPQPTDRLTEVHKNFRRTVRSNNNPTKRLSKDPFLNSILQETISIEQAEREAQQLGLLEEYNLPTDANGRVISSNTNVDHVLEAMNRDYSGMFNKDKGKSPEKNTRSQFRDTVLSIMENDFQEPTQKSQQMKIQSGFPSVEPFSGEEEDLSWLNEVS